MSYGYSGGGQNVNGSGHPINGFYLEAVTVSINYADFLRVFLEQNLSHFDRLVVVTSHEDHETQALCREFSVHCVPTDAHTQHDEKLNKGACVNLALGHLRNLGWVIQMDADIILPPRFRNLLQLAALDPDCIYGADRMLVKSYDHWLQAQKDMTPQFKHSLLVEAPAHTACGARLVHHQYGYIPMGCFQMWHSSKGKPYPMVHGNAAETDVLFGLMWPQNKRVLLPTVKVFHLESEPVPMGANWRGRKSKRFGTWHGTQAEPSGYA